MCICLTVFFFFSVYLWGWPYLGEIFAYVTVFSSNHWGSHIPSSWMVHAWCVFVACIHPSWTWMSGSFEPWQWNACVYGLDLFVLSSERIWGEWSQNLCELQGKNPLWEKMFLRGESNPQCCIKQDCEPYTLPMSCSGPCTLLFCYSFLGLVLRCQPWEQQTHVWFPLSLMGIFRVQSYQWLKNLYFSGYLVKCLIVQGQHWDWLTWCQKIVTGWDGKFDQQL